MVQKCSEGKESCDRWVVKAVSPEHRQLWLEQENVQGGGKLAVGRHDFRAKSKVGRTGWGSPESCGDFSSEVIIQVTE